VVRKTAGYARFEGDETLAALKKVYSYLNPLINYFYPTRKLTARDKFLNGKIKRSMRNNSRRLTSGFLNILIFLIH
jgi:hypothetical protein